MQSRESEDTPPFCGTDLLPWEFIIMINSKQYSLDIRSTPTLEDLNKRVEDHLLSKDKAEKKPRLLYYLDGTQKRWIKSEEDYKTYLKQRKSSNHLDLYSVQERAPLLSSFEENANRLIQTYKLKG